MGYFDPIQGTRGRFVSPYEIIVTGTVAGLTSLREKLSLHNKAVQQQIRRLQLTKPRSTKHLHSIQSQLAELKSQEYVNCWADTPDGVSIPPGCYFMLETVENPEVILAPQMDIKWLGIERPYQTKAINALLRYRRASVQLATGTGKSKLIQVLTRTFTSVGKRVVVIVPSTELLKQTFYPLQKDGSFSVSMLGDGNQPKLGVQAVVSTMQSVLSIADQFDVIITDELQHAACNFLQNTFASAINAEYVYGLSASPWRADGMTQLIWNFSGALVYKYNGAQAIKDGYLSPLIYVQKAIPVTSTPKPSMLPIKKYIYLHSSDAYINSVEKHTRDALDKGRKVLVLFRSIQCCKKLGARLGVSSADGEHRAPFYAFKKGETNLCIANISLLGEGIDVPDISAIIYCAGSTSEVSVVQAFGRGTRTAPGKNNCVILDLYPALSDWGQKTNIRKKYFQRHFEDLDEEEVPTMLLEEITTNKETCNDID